MSHAAPEVSAANTIWQNIYRLGPALLYVPMIAGSIGYFPWRHYDSWPVYVIFLGWPAALIWHVVLITTEREKWHYGLYATLNLGAYLGIGFVCLNLVATGGM